jgi:hypothetical protein
MEILKVLDGYDIAILCFLGFAIGILVAVFRTPSRNDYTDPGHVSGFQAIETLRRGKKG